MKNMERINQVSDLTNGETIRSMYRYVARQIVPRRTMDADYHIHRQGDDNHACSAYSVYECLTRAIPPLDNGYGDASLQRCHRHLYSDRASSVMNRLSNAGRPVTAQCAPGLPASTIRYPASVHR